MKKVYSYNIGDRIDDIVIQSIFQDPNRSNVTTYHVKCAICGREKDMLGPTIFRHSGTTHKACGKGLKLQDPLFYSKWQSMRSRTTNPNMDHYKDYGGRGINSDEFANFIDFYDSMYPSYVEAYVQYGNNVSLERVDANGNYCKDNCTWIDVAKQRGNTRKTVYFQLIDLYGHVYTFKNINEFCEEHGFNHSVIHDLITGRLQTAYNGLLVGARRITKEEYDSIVQSEKCND